MGTWGTALFSDDTASDVRGEFRTHIGDGLTPEQATDSMLAEWGSVLSDPDVGPTFWLALAATQWSLGRLLPKVQAEALRVLDSGGDLSLWASDPRQQEERRRVLDRLRQQLVSPQPPAKRVPRTFRDSNSWAIGSVHAYTLNTGELCLLRVIGHHTDKGGTGPVLELLDWVGNEVPDRDTMGRLQIRRHIYPNGRQISQFLLGATSERELKRARVKDTGLVLPPAQAPAQYSVLLWRKFDEDLASLFGFGRPSVPPH